MDSKNNRRHTSKNDRKNLKKSNRYKKNKLENLENVSFNFNTFTQPIIKKSSSSNYNQQEQLKNTNIEANKENSTKNHSNSNVNELGKKFIFNFKRLEELCKKDMSEIIFVMSNKSNGFMDLFKQNKGPDWIFLLMQISAKICSTEFIQNKTVLLTELISNQFFDHLKTYILSTPTEKNVSRCNNMNTFFDDCLVVFQSIIILFPKTAVDQLREIIVSSNIALTGIQNYCRHIQINDITISGMNEVLQKLDETKLTKELELKEKSMFDNIAQYFPPPENFRELTVYPTATDFEYGKPFLRPNIIQGAYQNVEHYLDVQFRLLREDFIAPLREGIQFYKESLNDQQQHPRKKKINHIRIYHGVEFEQNGEFIFDKHGFIVNFDKKNKLNINWEMAKRFMYGSLLLFTVNGFRTFFLGVVLERKIQLLKKGKLIVELLEESKPVYGTSLTMVESEVFFEPYKCSMNVLKTINSHNFPMEKYIISACIEIDFPLYIDELTDHNYLIDDLYEFNVLDHNNWPTKEELGLDIMQYRAFNAALTHEFTVIQGPPGTGKTFIGLKIMKAIINNLYQNKNSLKLSNSNLIKPILVVCYTNHALDQFMEGILSFTNQVVRIGGQCKSEIIEKYSLRNITRMYRRSVITNKGLQHVKNQLESCMDKIKYFRKCSETLSYNAGIIELSLLKNGMPKKYHRFFQTTRDLLSWLFQDFNYFSANPVEFINAFCNELINNPVSYSATLLEIKHEVEEDDYANIKYEYDDPDLEFNYRDIIIYSITLDDIKSVCKELLLQTIELENKSNLNLEFYNAYEEVKFNLNVMEQIHDYFTYMLSLADTEPDLPKSIYDLNKLGMKQRWTLYFCWVRIAQSMFGPKLRLYEQKYVNIHKQYSELRELENIEVLNKMHVIALTTTGAAKHRTMLEGLESPIVLVEEAAEVLEAHIISSLTRHCQHLILIGDHKQLRPSNAVYKLAKDFNFDISLFERMVNNNVPCYTLGEQHRMRPEIASLITPTIYPELKNHISVYDRECVRGVTKNLFFLNHNVYEKEVDEIVSKSNEHEAKFLIKFARHLLLQGYNTDQVTILTTYSGQLFLLRALKKNYSMLKEMKITVVDNYQGEESDIILLSLVRSNERGNVGFLKTENRICVALSRAKYGLYIMGNMNNLYNSGDLWKQLKETLLNQDSYGDELTLECVIHSGITTKVSKGEDFNMIVEGGCTMLCKSLLPCGHYCTSICHPYDREHENVKCQELCNKRCDYNHPCNKPCFMDCGRCTEQMLKTLPCNHILTLPCFVNTVTFPCEENVEVVLVECNHKIIKRCHNKNPNCTFKCIDRLNCGHACERNCHKTDDADHEKYKCLKKCEKINKNCSLNHTCEKLCHEDCSDCFVKIEKELPCGHIKSDVPCGFNVNKVKCHQNCNRLRPCNHKCTEACYVKCKPCEIKVKKTIPDCGHSVTIECNTIAQREHCKQICNRTLICGHKCKSVCSKECTIDDCEEIVLQKIGKLACGHTKVYVKCCDKDKDFRMDSQYLLDKCREPCLQKLNCGDTCLGTCGQCKQGRLHIPCNEPCNKINPCNHTCNFPCKESCPPCNKKCLYSCVHSKCALICGKPCVSCKEDCIWQCSHLKCTNKCGKICNRKPCYESCSLKLDCGHKCIGFCGEPCPPLCRICQNDEVSTIIFGNEDEPDARFVYLEDCGHSVESDALEKWLSQNDEEIALKQCPICKTPILKTQRFMNQVKVILEDISKIKSQLYGKLAVIKMKKRDILKTLKCLCKEFNLLFIGDIRQYGHIAALWKTHCKPLLDSLSYKKGHYGDKQYSLAAKNIESLEFVFNLFKSISKYKIRIRALQDCQMKIIVDHFSWLLSVAFTYVQQLSNQQKFDINIEVIRGKRILTLFEIMSDQKYKMAVGMQFSSDATEIKNLVHNMEALLMSCTAYNAERDDEIQNFVELIKKKIVGITIITDEERKMINEAMSSSFLHTGLRAQGHWCKCSNGHIYCITECGGPMEKSNCPECKVEIGGDNHRHVQGVEVASEMDGATRLAYT